jgi:hypothetical protein
MKINLKTKIKEYCFFIVIQGTEIKGSRPHVNKKIGP